MADTSTAPSISLNSSSSRRGATSTGAVRSSTAPRSRRSDHTTVSSWSGSSAASTANAIASACRASASDSSPPPRSATATSAERGPHAVGGVARQRAQVRLAQARARAARAARRTGARACSCRLRSSRSGISLWAPVEARSTSRANRASEASESRTPSHSAATSSSICASSKITRSCGGRIDTAPSEAARRPRSAMYSAWLTSTTSASPAEARARSA